MATPTAPIFTYSQMRNHILLIMVINNLLGLDEEDTILF